MNNQTDDQEIDLTELFYAVWHRLPVIILLALVAAVITYLILSFFVAPTYSASADMIVNNQSTTVTTDTTTYSDLMASSELVSTYSVILKSNVVLEQVIADLNLPYTVKGLANMIAVSSVEDTPIMRIRVEDTNADEALAIVTDLVAFAPDAIMSTTEAGSVKTVGHPEVNATPVSPNKKRDAMIAALVIVVLCVVVIYIRFVSSDTIKTEKDIRNELDLPVLAVIPQDNSQTKRGAR